jgi:hypothetical protein
MTGSRKSPQIGDHFVMLFRVQEMTEPLSTTTPEVSLGLTQKQLHRLGEMV